LWSRSARRFGVQALGAVVLVAAGSGAVPVVAQETLPEVEVIGVTPMPGTGVARDRVPAAVQTITDEDIDALQPRNLTDLVEQSLRGVSVTDVQNSPYQQNLSYRGFTLSPLLGEPQGLAVYMNGVRINEGFGDTIQWDLIPEAAIRRIDLVGGNPAYGLNALGGALSLQTHTGLSFSGSEFEIKGGSHGRLDTTVQAGGKLDATGIYVAAERGAEDGWRDHSDSSILRLFGDATHVFERGSLGISALFARTEITGNGATPVDLLEFRRESLFTYPDITDNDLGTVTIRGDFEISDTMRISGVAYHRDLHRDTINGDEFDGGISDQNSGYLLAGEIEEEEEEEGEEEEEETVSFLFGYPQGSSDRTPRPIVIADGSASQLAALKEAFYEHEVEEEDDDEMDHEMGEEMVEDDDGDGEKVIVPGAHNLTSTDTSTQGLALQLGMTQGAHEVALGVAYDQSETAFESVTLAGQLYRDRYVPPLLIDGEAYVLSHEYECEVDDIDECEEEIEEGEVDPEPFDDNSPVSVQSETSALGFYVSDTFALSARTDLTASGRYNRVVVDVDIAGRPDESWTYNRFNPAIGLTHRFTDNMSVFGGYREANRAPTAAELGCADEEFACRLPNAFVADPYLKQVVTRSVEAGLRGRTTTAAGPVAWELGSYASVNEDDILFVAVTDPTRQPGLGYFRNFGETRRVGFDGQVGGRFDSWDWNANYSYVRATFAEDDVLPGANHPHARVIESEDGDEGRVIDVAAGNQIPGVPEHTVKLGVGYTLANGLRIGTTLVARAGVYLRGDESNQLEKTDGYSLVNLTLDWQIGALTLFGRIENLLGADYSTFGILGECEDEGDGCEGEVPILELHEGRHEGHRFLSPGAPQSFYVGMRYQF
jgi:outer membrane receptor protein involved in Fe transport